MATRRKPILNGTLVPDTNGEVHWEPLSIKGSNGRWEHGVWVFNASATRDSLFGSFEVPQDYVAGAAIIIRMADDGSVANVAAWDFDYRTTVAGASIDQTGEEETANVDLTADATPFEWVEGLISLTAVNFSPGDFVQFELARDQTDADDTLAADALLVSLNFEYTN